MTQGVFVRQSGQLSQLVAPSTLDALSDVNVSDADPGYVLALDPETNQWVARPEGGIVGLWESKTVNFTPAPLFEMPVDPPAALPTSKPALAILTFTVTEDMLATVISDSSDDEPIGHEKVLIIWACVNLAGQAGGSVTTFEFNVGGTTYLTATGSVANTAKVTGLLGVRNPVVGETVEVRAWSNNSGSVLPWCGLKCYGSRFFINQPPEGGTYLYRRLAVDSVTTLPAPSGLPSAASISPQLLRFFEEDVNQGGPAVPSVLEPRYIASKTMGMILLNSSFDTQSNARGVANVVTSTNYPIQTPTCPEQLTYHRLKIPAPPT